MSIQLTIRVLDTDTPHFSGPAQRLEFTRLPVSLGGPDCDVALPGLQGELALITQDEEGFFLQCRAATELVLAQQRLAAPEKRRLKHGESFRLQAYEIVFYRRFARVALSWQSGFLAAAVKYGIALILLLQLFAITLLPGLMKEESFWLGQRMHLDISAKSDRLREMLQKADSKDPIVQTMQQAFKQELQQRTRYLRRHSQDMSRAQRRRMLQALQSIENELLALQESNIYGIYPQPELQTRIIEIIQSESQP
jgi:hypothetical protein